ncbi:DUF4184 family protein, partial [Streptomyces sp. NRRL B-24085]|uniref:DUF4184 family protein n=1 Tax=Streptomyces sp. NRRL B-24085 TaxID=1709476 RepID=UPI00211B4EC1
MIRTFDRAPQRGDPCDPTTTSFSRTPVRARYSPVGHVRSVRVRVAHTGRDRSSGPSPGQHPPRGAPLPFTLSHAAAVLPAVRTDGTGRGRLVPAVLVAGSFSPDMTYYAASVVSGAMEFGAVTHSFAGVLTVDVLVAWALVGLWLVLREPLVALLPRGRQGGVAALLRCGAPRAR